jgi:hypothetical protein
LRQSRCVYRQGRFVDPFGHIWLVGDTFIKRAFQAWKRSLIHGIIEANQGYIAFEVGGFYTNDMINGYSVSFISAGRKKAMAGMNDILSQSQFDFISNQDKTFILAFTDEMSRLGYDFGGKIGSGFCWGKYMLIFTKTGVKSKNVFARIYIRDSSILLRLFLSKIDQHRAYIENAPSHIKEVFVGSYGNCNHCHNEKDGACQFRKTYTLDDRLIEKCNGTTFEFHDPCIHKLSDYIALFTEFYPYKLKHAGMLKTGIPG